MTILHFEIMFGLTFFSHCVTIYFFFNLKTVYAYEVHIFAQFVFVIHIKKRLSSQKEDAAQKKIAWLSLWLVEKAAHSTTPKRKLFLFELNAILCFVYLSH